MNGHAGGSRSDTSASQLGNNMEFVNNSLSYEYGYGLRPVDTNKSSMAPANMYLHPERFSDGTTSSAGSQQLSNPSSVRFSNPQPRMGVSASSTMSSSHGDVRRRRSLEIQQDIDVPSVILRKNKGPGGEFQFIDRSRSLGNLPQPASDNKISDDFRKSQVSTFTGMDNEQLGITYLPKTPNGGLILRAAPPRQTNKTDLSLDNGQHANERISRV